MGLVEGFRDIALCVAVFGIACARDPDPEGAARARTGVVFDPRAIHPGDTVAGLVVTQADIRLALADSTPVGTVAFSGLLTLGGNRIAHFDSDARAGDGGRPVCFEADSASAVRMPRWAGDRRRPWFCFVNTAEARRALSADSIISLPRRITIDAFTVHRGLSDEVNSARLVRVEP